MITIVVLLILAGVSISLVISNDGIISKAKEATEKTKEAQDNTDLFFNGVVDEIDKALGDVNVSDEEFEKNPTDYKHEDQSEDKKDTAIGTDGKPVNLDLWYYEVRFDGALCLGHYGASGVYESGYKNEDITSDGKIEGTVPKKIYIASLNEVLPVTVMHGTFYRCTNLETAPEIPDSVTELNYTFEGCTSLTTVPTIPENVTNMNNTFFGCTGLTVAPTIPENVTYMDHAFSGCTGLTVAPTIPNSVTSMFYTFRGCTGLTVAPTIPENVTNMGGTFIECTGLTVAPAIPESVNDMWRTFKNCTSLTGTITINANLNSASYYKDECFSGTVKPIVLKGTSPNLAELAATATNGNVTVENN